MFLHHRGQGRQSLWELSLEEVGSVEALQDGATVNGMLKVALRAMKTSHERS